MKRSIVTLLLLAFVVMLTTSYVIIPVKSKPTAVNYYWFDVTKTWMGRQNPVLDEMALTGLDESMANPKTNCEYGWSPANCNIGQFGEPTPILAYPDKILYSHP